MLSIIRGEHPSEPVLPSVLKLLEEILISLYENLQKGLKKTQGNAEQLKELHDCLQKQKQCETQSPSDEEFNPHGQLPVTEQEISDAFLQYQNALLELRQKSADFEQLKTIFDTFFPSALEDKAEADRKEAEIACLEEETACLRARLEAARLKADADHKKA